MDFKPAAKEKNFWFDEYQNYMEGKRGLDTQMINVSAHLEDAERRNDT